MADLEKLLGAWALAKKALEKADEELRAVKAGHEVALRCEREAWEAMERLRPKAAEVTPPPVAVTEEKMAQALRAAQERAQAQQRQYQVSTGYHPFGVSGVYSYSGAMNSATNGYGSGTGWRAF